MRIVAVLEAEPADGGGFHQALASIAQLHERRGDDDDIHVLTTHRGNLEVVRSLGANVQLIRVRLLDHVFARASLSPWWRPVQRWLRILPPLEKRLQGIGCDLVYFLNPSALPNALQRLNFAVTVLDLAHRDEPAFPEVREFGIFRARELQLSCLPSSVLVITDSAESVRSIVRRYGIDPGRVVAIPFAASPLIRADGAEDSTSVLSRYSLDPGYFFYPAQFWSHKNHLRILEALLLLRAQGHSHRVVFAGGDRGNRRHLESFVDRNGLHEAVAFLGLVPPAHMRALYEACLAVVMPTYFGPTNIPPIEGWVAGRPCIYSAAFRDQVGDAALCVDPDDPVALAAAMRSCTDPDVVQQLVLRGHERLLELERRRDEAFAAVWTKLRQFEARRRCWA